VRPPRSRSLPISARGQGALSTLCEPPTVVVRNRWVLHLFFLPSSKLPSSRRRKPVPPALALAEPAAEVLPHDADVAAFQAVWTPPALVNAQIGSRWRYSGLHSASTSCARRLTAMAQYFSSISIPMASLPKSFAARNVVPEPQNGSRITPSGHLRMRARISSSGF